jgi:hypothetical protein
LIASLGAPGAGRHDGAGGGSFNDGAGTPRGEESGGDFFNKGFGGGGGVGGGSSSGHSSGSGGGDDTVGGGGGIGGDGGGGAPTGFINTGGPSTGASQPVSPVPEPETYAMMLMGLSVIGFMARRKRRKA